MISLKAVMEVSIYHFHFDTSNIIQINPRLLLTCIVGCDIFISLYSSPFIGSDEE